MKACAPAILGYAAAHQEYSRWAYSHPAPEGAAEWLREQNPPRLELRGALVVAPDTGGIGNVMRILGQYAVLGVLLQRAVFFELSPALREQLQPFMGSPLINWRAPPALQSGSRTWNASGGVQDVYVQKHVRYDPAFPSCPNGTIYHYLRLFGTANVSAHFTAPVVRVIADSSRVLPDLLRNPHLFDRAPFQLHERHTLASCVRQLFMQPTRRTVAAAEPYLRMLRFPQPYKSVHLRLGDVYMGHRDDVALNLSVSDRRVRPDRIKRLLTCVESRVGGANVSSFFVATDAEFVELELRRRFGTHVVLTVGITIHNMNNNIRHNASLTKVSMQKVWLDFFLLSLGRNATIASGGRLSSFAEEAFTRDKMHKVPAMVRC